MCHHMQSLFGSATIYSAAGSLGLIPKNPLTSLQCTYAPACTSSVLENAEELANYKMSKGAAGTTFTCLYDSGNTHYVIRMRHGTVRVLHVILWPTLGILGFTIGIAMVYLTCGCRYIWSSRPPDIIRQEALTRTFETIAIAPYQNLGESV